ncbi:MAG: ABC transporter substrate-binding protein [Candidatus Manganitrophus sp.]|nr:MAG: ABC transporter substrate-binding protein [Candidatus Manganitrophus sp.]
MKRIRPVAWILALFLVLADSSFGMTAEESVSPKKPQRIVSLTLGTDEILFSLVDPKRIAAVTYLAADPGISHVAEAAKGVPNKIRANMEQVVALQPDLVFVATYTSMDVVKQLTEARLPVVKLELFSSIEGIKRNILTVGQMVGESRRAEEIVAEMDRKLKAIAERVAAATRRPGILFYTPTGVVAGKETTFDEIAALIGARNQAGEAGLVGHQKMSVERLIQLDPEIVIVSEWNPEEDDFYQKLMAHPELGHLSAIRNRRVYSISEKHLSTVSHYIVDGIEQMTRIIHPEWSGSALGQQGARSQ